VVYGLKEPEMCNRVLRMFKNYEDMFLRIKITDEDGYYIILKI
jgi:hypothetical protein